MLQALIVQPGQHARLRETKIYNNLAAGVQILVRAFEETFLYLNYYPFYMAKKSSKKKKDDGLFFSGKELQQEETHNEFENDDDDGDDDDLEYDDDVTDG